MSYFITSRIGVGVGCYFELDVVDFNTIDTDGPVGFAPAGGPRLDWLGGLTLGYGNRPYSGHTGFVRCCIGSDRSNDEPGRGRP